MKVIARIVMDMVSNRLSIGALKGSSHTCSRRAKDSVTRMREGSRMFSEGSTEIRMANRSRRTGMAISNQKYRPL